MVSAGQGGGHWFGIVGIALYVTQFLAVHKWSLHYGITVFITLFKCLSQGFNALGICSILIKYTRASNHNIGLKPKRDLAGK